MFRIVDLAYRMTKTPQRCLPIPPAIEVGDESTALGVQPNKLTVRKQSIRPLEGAASCYWICWWRCDNASRKGKAMTISSYSFFQSKRVKSHEANSIHSSFSSALVKWSLWFAFPCDYAFCGELLLTLHSCFRGNKNCYGWRSCDLFLLLSPVGEWVTQWKRGEEVTSQPKATLHSYDSLSQDLRFGFYAFHLC